MGAVILNHFCANSKQSIHYRTFVSGQFKIKDCEVFLQMFHRGCVLKGTMPCWLKYRKNICAGLRPYFVASLCNLASAKTLGYAVSVQIL